MWGLNEEKHIRIKMGYIFAAIDVVMNSIKSINIAIIKRLKLTVNTAMK